jgi:hypothetical protein
VSVNFHSRCLFCFHFCWWYKPELCIIFSFVNFNNENLNNLHFFGFFDEIFMLIKCLLREIKTPNKHVEDASLRYINQPPKASSNCVDWKIWEFTIKKLIIKEMQKSFNEHLQTGYFLFFLKSLGRAAMYLFSSI